MSISRILSAALVVGVCASVSVSQAATWNVFRIGDIDGFGFNGTDGPTPADGAWGSPWGATTWPSGPFRAANGALADTNGNGRLEAGEFLPDVNQGGSTLTGGGDDWDNRTVAEISNTSVYFDGTGTTNMGTTGSKWTDITLSTSYDITASADNALGAFPDPAGISVPNEPTFNFNFNIDKTENPDPFQVYFNVLFGDYDVTPASILLSLSGGTNLTIPLTVQPPREDGLIQGAYATLDFSDVFSDGGSTWNASLGVGLVAPNEPYTAFDYVELSRVPIEQQPVPEPTTLLLLGSGLVGLAGYGRKRKK